MVCLCPGFVTVSFNRSKLLNDGSNKVTQVTEKARIDVNGRKEDFEYKLTGKGNEMAGFARGDVYIYLRYLPNLNHKYPVYEYYITVGEALAGIKKQITLQLKQNQINVFLNVAPRVTHGQLETVNLGKNKNLRIRLLYGNVPYIKNDQQRQMMAQQIDSILAQNTNYYQSIKTQNEKCLKQIEKQASVNDDNNNRNKNKKGRGFGVW